MKSASPTANETTAADTDHEAALVAAARAGDRSAFEELVHRYERKVFRLALNITKNREDAEEVTQDAFLKCIEHLSDFRGGSRFYTWLVRIAVNQGLMKLRKRRSDKSAPIEDCVDEEGQLMPREFADPSPNPEQIMQQVELEAILQKAARALHGPFGAVFFLREVREISTEETAKLLNLTKGAVRSRLCRARRVLQGKFERLFGPAEVFADHGYQRSSG